jgi:hypothetical protein
MAAMGFPAALNSRTISRTRGLSGLYSGARPPGTTRPTYSAVSTAAKSLFT